MTEMNLNTQLKKLEILNEMFVQQNAKNIDWLKIPQQIKKDLSQFDALSLDDLLYVIGRTNFANGAEWINVADVTVYGEAVQKIIKRSGNYILFREQLRDLYCLAGGQPEKANRFVRDWNLKKSEVREGWANEMMLGGRSIKSLMETLCFDQENYFVCAERYEMASEFLYNVRAVNAQNGVLKHNSGITYIDYLGDASSDKRPDIKDRWRSGIALKPMDEQTIHLELGLEIAGQHVPVVTNILGSLNNSNNIYLMNPSFVEMVHGHQFIFSAILVYVIDDQPEHFEFMARFYGALPEGIRAGRML
jgi:hypothetical protein